MAEKIKDKIPSREKYLIYEAIKKRVQKTAGSPREYEELIKIITNLLGV